MQHSHTNIQYTTVVGRIHTAANPCVFFTWRRAGDADSVNACGLFTAWIEALMTVSYLTRYIRCTAAVFHVTKTPAHPRLDAVTLHKPSCSSSSVHGSTQHIHIQCKVQRSFNGGKEGEKQYRRQTGNKQTCKWRTWIWTKSRANHRLICTCHFKCLISRYNPDVIQPAVAEEEEEEGLLSCYGLWLGSKPPTNLLFILMSHQIKDVVSSNCAASGCCGSENWMYAGLARTFVRAAWAYWTKTDVPQCIARLQDVQCIVRQAVLCTLKSVNRIQTDHTAAVSEIKPHVVTNNMMTMKKSGAFVFQWLQVKSIQLPVSVSAGSDRTAWVCSRKCVMGFTDHFTFSGDTWTSFVCSSHHDPPVLNRPNTWNTWIQNWCWSKTRHSFSAYMWCLE